MASLRVLIVEDDRDLADNLAELVDSLGHQALVAADGVAALELLATTPVDAILTDYRLPRLDGVELLTEARRRHVRVPAVVLSGFIDARARARAEEAGALEVLAKPLEPKRLAALLAELALQHRRVLIVEDNEALADNIAEALRLHGFEADVTATGKAALADRRLHRVAVVDLRLPDAAGVDIAKKLKARNAGLHVVFVSAFSEELERLRDEARAPDMTCIDKPFDVDALVSRVQEVVDST